jgi:hypothetical protein
LKREQLHEQVLGALQKRTGWENRQSLFYEMRHNGLRRKVKPFPNASDLHFPLIDTNIEKLKPFYFQQIAGMDVVASFIPMDAQAAELSAFASQWFDYKIKERTNFQAESLSWIDHTLMAGRAVLKCYWSPEKKQVCFDAIDPLYFIVPPHTTDLQNADWCVHVMKFSVPAYKRSGRYKADAETIEQIKGGGTADGGQEEKEQAKHSREGLTHDSTGEKIIVWELYERTAEGWVVHTYSPSRPEINLADKFILPYKHGEVPFVDACYEVKDKGWFSPRGMCEILAPFEASLCSLWNHKHDAMAFYNQPLFRAERDLGNTLNFRMKPGGILPYGIVPAAQGQPPMSFSEEMISTRSIAEQRVQNPDYGMGQVIDTKNRRTATEIESINAVAMQNSDLRARIFRLALGRLYKQAWSLLLQYDSQDLAFKYLDVASKAQPDALHGRYYIEPKGGVDMVSRSAKLQQAVQRKALFAQSPWIDQPELDKTILELDDPALVKRLFHDPQLKKQDEAADEAKTVPALLSGLVIPPKGGQDYPARIGVLMGYVQKEAAKGTQVPQDGTQAIMQRLGMLLDAYEQVDTNNARQLRNEIGQWFDMQAKPQNIVPMPPG